MRIICDNCQTEYDVPSAVLSSSTPSRRLKFRCSYCGHTFTPDLGERRRSYDDSAPIGEDEDEYSAVDTLSDVGAEPAGFALDSMAIPAAHQQMERVDSFKGLPPPVADGVADADGEASLVGGSMLLKQEGKIYHVRDIATLQRWIVERRVLPEDLVSREGVRWEPVGEQPELQVFLNLVDQVETTDSDEDSMSDGIRAATPPEEGWSNVDSPAWASQGEPAREEHSEDQPTDHSHDVPPAAPPQVEPDGGPPRIDLGYRSPEENPVPDDTTDPVYIPREEAEEPTDDSISQVLTDSPSVQIPQGPKPTPPAEEEKDQLAGVGLLALAAVLLLIIVVVIFFWNPKSATVADNTADAGAQVAQRHQEGVVPPNRGPVHRRAPQKAEAVHLNPPQQPRTPEEQQPPADALPDKAAPNNAEAVPADAAKDGAATASPEEPVGEPTQVDAVPATEEPESAAPVAQAEPVPSASSKESRPSTPTAKTLTKKGWAAMEEQDFGNARKYFIDATSLNPSDGWAFYGLGYAADKQGDFRTAKDAYCRAWSVGQGDIDLIREVEGRLRVHSHTCQ